VESKTLADLKPDQQNARKHNPRNIGMIAKAIGEVGVARSIVIDEDGNILAGNGTVEAVAECGITDVRVIKANGNELIAVQRTGLTPEQKKKLALYDNRTAELADWDIPALKEIEIGMPGLLEDMFMPLELDELLDLSTDIDPIDGEDDAPEAPEEPISKLGDIYQLGEHRLMCGDSTDKETVGILMDGQKADMVFTDPPYALFGSSTGVEGITDDRMVSSFFRDLLIQAKMNVKSFGHIYICCDWHSAFSIERISKEIKLKAKNLCIWDKGDGGVGAMYQQCYEMVWFFDNSPTNQGTMRSSNMTGVITVNGVPNIWRVNRVRGTEREHNAQKPVELIAIPIKNGSPLNGKILDLFGGSGSTLIACEKLDRKCYMMEIDPAYCDVIVKRWEEFTGKKAELIKELVNG